ncbi:hypothetical protein PGB90_002942 [Kerria lacca]
MQVKNICYDITSYFQRHVHEVEKVPKIPRYIEKGRVCITLAHPKPAQSCTTVNRDNNAPVSKSVMPFIEDELLWCPDNDTKMVDISQCLENGGGLGELSHSDLSGLETGLEPEEDAEDIFKQLSDSSFELEQFFNFSNEVKEENNNNVISSNNRTPATVALLHELQKNASSCNRRFNIAAANPLLAEKLSSPATANGNKTNTQIFPNSNINHRLIKSEPGSLQNRTEALCKRLDFVVFIEEDDWNRMCSVHVGLNVDDSVRFCMPMVYIDLRSSHSEVTKSDIRICSLLLFQHSHIIVFAMVVTSAVVTETSQMFLLFYLRNS